MFYACYMWKVCLSYVTFMSRACFLINIEYVLKFYRSNTSLFAVPIFGILKLSHECVHRGEGQKVAKRTISSIDAIVCMWPGTNMRVDSLVNWRHGTRVCLPTTLPRLAKWWGWNMTHLFGSQWWNNIGSYIVQINILVYLFSGQLWSGFGA